MRKIITINFILGIIIFISCSDNNQDKKNKNVELPKQLNITILLDLSDRIIQPMQPTQSERDIQAVKNIVNCFKKKMENDGTILTKGKIRIVFEPIPMDPEINNIAKKLNIDISNFTTKDKKKIYDSIEYNFESGLRKIYEMTINTRKWLGSDIWGFFKYNAKKICIDKDTMYRNILVIITDGYLYEEGSRYRDKNRTSYLTSVFIQNEGLRNLKWKEKFDKGDYGYINSGETYNNLEILVLEINPYDIIDEDIIRAYLDKWFSEMKIKRWEIIKTDLPENNKSIISDFILNNTIVQNVFE
jgi:hypothetical protein